MRNASVHHLLSAPSAATTRASIRGATWDRPVAAGPPCVAGGAQAHCWGRPQTLLSLPPSSLTRSYRRVSAEKRTSQPPSPAADAARAEQLGIADQPTHLHAQPGLGSKLHLPAQQGGSAAVGVGPQRVVVAAGRQLGKCGGVEGILAPVAVAGGVRMLPSIMLFAVDCSRPCPANGSQTD